MIAIRLMNDWLNANRCEYLYFYDAFDYLIVSDIDDMIGVRFGRLLNDFKVIRSSTITQIIRGNTSDFITNDSLI